VNSLKQAIRNLIRGSFPHVWSIDDLLRALPCDREMLNAALAELMADGQVRKTGGAELVPRW